MTNAEIATLIDLVERALVTCDRQPLLAALRQLVRSSSGEGPAWDIARDLVWDLNFYEPDPRLRGEDPSYYGDERLKQELWHAIEKLRAAQVFR